MENMYDGWQEQRDGYFLDSRAALEHSLPRILSLQLEVNYPTNLGTRAKIGWQSPRGPGFPAVLSLHFDCVTRLSKICSSLRNDLTTVF